MSDNVTTPDAEQPATLAQNLFELECVGHANGEAEFKNAGISYEVVAWMDDDETAGDVATVCKAIQRAGYRVDTIGETDTTDSVVIRAEDA